MRIKRVALIIILSLIVSVTISFAEGQQESVEKNPITLTLATYHPSEGYRSLGSRLLKEEIEKFTNGMVKIDIYFGASLLRSDEMLTGVQRGVTDMGLVTPDYYPTQLPLNAAMPVFPKVPGPAAEKAEAMSRIYEKYPVLNEEFENFNQVIILQNFPQPVGLISVVPVNSINDFSGLNIRAAGDVFLNMLAGAGANPVSLPFEDCYMALQTGTIDGVLTNIDGINSAKLYEPAPNSFTHPNFSIWLAFTYTMNKNTWDKLTPELQSQIRAAAKEADRRMAEAYDNQYEIVLKEQRDNNTRVVMASEEDLDAWANMPIVSELKESYAKKAEEAGVQDGMQMVRDIESILAEY